MWLGREARKGSDLSVEGALSMPTVARYLDDSAWITFGFRSGYHVEVVSDEVRLASLQPSIS